MYLYGAGGHARVVRDILESQGLKVSGIYDDNLDVAKWMENEVSHELNTDDEIIVCIGKAENRKTVVERLQQLGMKFGTAIHQSAIVSPFAEIGEGSVLMAGTIVNSGSRIGRHCIINTGAVVEHECLTGDYVHISPHATLCGSLTIGEGSWIGAGAVVVQGVKVGKWSIIGAGSVVLKDIPDGVVAYGNPCKVIRRIEEAEINKYEKTH
ncbi:MAG: acetyltransferase [Prevotella sp.]|nr:acetyltransferase [Prevotella sp.]